MTESEFDRIVANDEKIVPSSGFAQSVMDAVRQEAATPKPIPFPWVRAVPGLVAIAIILVAIAVSSHGSSAEPQIRNNLSPVVVAAMQAVTSPVTIWIGFVLLLTFASIQLSARFCGGKA